MKDKHFPTDQNPRQESMGKESADMGAERRASIRKTIHSIHVSDLTAMNNYGIIAREGAIIDASPFGFLMTIKRRDLVPIGLKENLTLDSLIGQQVVLFLPEMNLDLDGKITRTAHKGKGMFEVAVEFSEDIPSYWRECLVDLLPKPGELDEEL